MKTFMQYITEAKRRPFKARVDKLASKMKIKKSEDKNYAASEPADIYSHQRKISGHDVRMVAQHMPTKNRSRIDFTVDGASDRTGKVGARKAKKILTHATAFAKKHHDNMGGGDHETEFTSMKASARYKNPEAKTKVYRKLVKRAGAKATEHKKVAGTIFRAKMDTDKQ